MKLNNLSARLMVNKNLAARGESLIDGELSYVDFATELRGRLAKKTVLVPFTDRAEACRYIREMAPQMTASLNTMGNA